MRILAISQYYSPDHSAIAQLSSELFEDLVAVGDEVTVIASRGTYLGGRTLPSEEVIRGVRVLRPWATSLGKRNVVRRLTDYASFWGTSIARASVVERPDVMVALTTPPMIAAGVFGVSAVRNVPLVTWVHDMYPEIPIAFGLLNEGGPAAVGLSALSRRTYRGSAAVVALSEGMAARLVEQGAPADRVRVIHNWADGGVLGPIAHADNPFRRAHDLEGRFVAMYSGNLGIGHDVGTFVDAARRLESSRPEILFLIVGDGIRRAEAELGARGLRNVRFMPYQPHATLRHSLAAADVHLISLRYDLAGLLVPSKLYSAAAVGRPILFVGPEQCEVARVVRDFELGWAGRPGDAEGLARALSLAATSPEWCAERGGRARAVFMTKFDRPVAVQAWRRALADAAKPRR